MRCPFCGATDTKVNDSRLTSEGNQVRRRRECLTCKERFTTYEMAELQMPRIVKSNDSREHFDEEKLRTGMTRALEKRSVATERVDISVSRIKHKLHSAGEREISSRRLGEWVMDELHDLDHVAYVRFASVYRDFEDVQAFRETIEDLEREPSPEAKRQQLSLLRSGDKS